MSTGLHHGPAPLDAEAYRQSSKGYCSQTVSTVYSGSHIVVTDSAVACAVYVFGGFLIGLSPR